MPNNSKAKLITDLLESDKSRWWGWDEILGGVDGSDPRKGKLIQGLIPGFENVPGRIQAEIISLYMTYVPGVLVELDERGYFLLSDGRAQMRRFKIATDAPEDLPEVKKRLAVMQEREDSLSSRKHLRINNLKKREILPGNWGLLSQ